MNHLVRIIVGVFMISLVLCARKTGSGNDTIAIAGTDTLTVAGIREEEPDTAGLGARMPIIILKRILASQAVPAADTAAFSATITEFAGQLSLRSGRSWNNKNSRTLYNAASALAARITVSPSAGSCKAYAESLYANVKNAPVLTIVPCGDSSVFTPAYIKLNMNNTLSKTLSWLLHIDQTSAELTANFVADQAGGAQSKTDVSKMVQGLIGSSAAPATAPSPAQLQKERIAIDNSKLALKFRPQDQITASISKRMPELEALYKRSLKISETMQGTVWATFTVSPGGIVMAVDLRSSQIRQRDFLEVLQKNLMTITFTAIPENVGDMTFEFPLQFAPQ